MPLKNLFKHLIGVGEALKEDPKYVPQRGNGSDSGLEIQEAVMSSRRLTVAVDLLPQQYHSPQKSGS